MSTFVKMLRDEAGASAAEYALILAIVGSGLAFAAFNLGNAIGNSLDATGDRITTCAEDASSADC